MCGYAIGHLRNVNVGNEIVEYLERIDATLEPFGGVFLIHGATAQCVEGKWSGDLIVIAFPSLKAARNWYNSPAYRAIAPLRARNADGEILLIEGVEEPHRATDVLKALLPA
ncbi:DUF1330 domain-containing protein [Manganibacter manganicus]|uniref:DUF1330 domain-containing protein n=1 Tax=Manganibacter manganicus TaxID=1873176 RepID=A0A1V8RNU6_9HYPH|nr:DUF1330 domain-containing protein [Pseudaminobacter manganicus]OQM74838.1 hypothetical protein BFN67_04200 [Pseudaminobacter manganicus]